MPETILLLIFVGLIAMAWIKPQREVMVLFLFNAGFILVMGLFPGAVLYDVNRLMLPVLPFLAGIAGAGFFFLTRWLIEHSQRIMMLQRVKYLRAKLIGTVSLLVLFPPAFDLMVYHPFELSYYNRLVGGIRGAYERGLEVTYFMEAFTPNLLSTSMRNCRAMRSSMLPLATSCLNIIRRKTVCDAISGSPIRKTSTTIFC